MRLSLIPQQRAGVFSTGWRSDALARALLSWPFMDRLTALIDGFIEGTLQPAERERLERMIHDFPSLAERVEVQRKSRQALTAASRNDRKCQGGRG
ncbi:MAG: hypothetical protein ACYCWW_18630 [Deltaproteobacteria bacterium]